MPGRRTCEETGEQALGHARFQTLTGVAGLMIAENSGGFESRYSATSA